MSDIKSHKLCTLGEIIGCLCIFGNIVFAVSAPLEDSLGECGESLLVAILDELVEITRFGDEWPWEVGIPLSYFFVILVSLLDGSSQSGGN